VASIARFNDVAYWVATSIVKEEKVRNRAKLMCRYIRIAEVL